MEISARSGCRQQALPEPEAQPLSIGPVLALGLFLHANLGLEISRFRQRDQDVAVQLSAPLVPVKVPDPV